MSAEDTTLAGRTAAEELMVDACVVTSDGAPATWDETTGTYVSTPAATVYAGPCQVQIPGYAGESNPDAGQREWTTQSRQLKLPVAGNAGVRVGRSADVKVGHTATVTGCVLDPSLVGATLTVVALHHKTFATARRLQCEEVTN